MRFDSFAQVHTAGFALLSALISCAAPASGQETQVVARTGDPAPDGNGDFASFINDPVDPDSTQAFGPTLNDAGQVSFPGFLENTDDGGDDNSGLYLYDGSQIVQIAREGATPPDGDGKFNRFNTNFIATLNNSGTVAFNSALTDSMSGEFFEWGVYAFRHGTLTQVLRQGDQAPDGESTLDAVFTPALNEQDGIAFTCEFVDDNPLGVRGMIRGNLDSGDLSVVAREDDSPPDGDGYFNLMSGGDLNDAGQMVFSVQIDSSTFDDEGIFRVEPDGALTRIVRKGDPSPDSDEAFSTLFSGSYNAINGHGQVAFASTMTDSGGQLPDSSAGVFLYDDGELVPIARTGRAGPNGSTYVSFGVPGTLTVAPALNDAGQVAFFGYILDAGFVYNGIFRSDGTHAGRTEIVRQAQATPDGNGVFQLDSQPSGFESNDVPKMNEAGQVAFFTNLSGTDGGIEENEGIFFYDDDLGLMQVARKGYPFLGSTITELRFTPRAGMAHDNMRSGLNNLGQVAFAYELADGRGGVAVWSPPGFSLPGDLNGDGCVDQADLGELLSAYGVDDGGDIDGDGDTDQADLGALLGNYGVGC